MPDSPASNAPDFTVSELSSALKRTIEDRFGLVRLRGEISNYRGPHSSGHAYFSLKDAGARIDAVIWKGNFARLKVKPQEGLEVVALGKITTFAGKSSYQIIVESLEPAGAGALMALYEERRRRLAAEGLFDEARKKPLPFLPRVVGVVTSPTGAVIRDILHRLADRFPRRVLVWPARMQGETSAAEVAAAIAGFSALRVGGSPPRPDVVIVARGGGSLEDLWSFNEEIVARAAAASEIPLISAIGHETDWTLLDFVADHRAPTPTGAAERAVPVRRQLAAEVAALGRRRVEAAARLLERRRGELRGLARALPGADALLAPPRQRLDHAARRLAAATARGGDARRLLLARVAQRLARQSPRVRLARIGEQVEGLRRRLRRAVETRRERRAEALRTLAARLVAARTKNVDQKRFVLSRTERRLSLRSPQARLTLVGERLESLKRRLSHAARARRRERADTLRAIIRRFDAARADSARAEFLRVAAERRKLDSLDARMCHVLADAMRKRRAETLRLGQLNHSLGYKNVLARGFALVRDVDGRLLRRAAEVTDGMALRIVFTDGEKAAVAGEPAADRPARRGRAKKPEQGSLF